MTIDKHALLFDLARQRKDTRWDDYRCLGDYHNGGYECDWVSPYSKTAHNADSSIFVMLQDWASENRLLKSFDPGLAEIWLHP
jgi:hypothetical protein